MIIHFITPKQVIQVDPVSYVGDAVQCEIAGTDITITVNINNLQTSKGEKVTRKMLSEMWE